MHFQTTWKKQPTKNFGVNIWAPIPIKNAVIHLGMTLDINSVTMCIFEIQYTLLGFTLTKITFNFSILCFISKTLGKTNFCVDLFPQVIKYQKVCRDRLWQIIQKSRKSVEINSCKLIIAKMYNKKWISTPFEPWYITITEVKKSIQK